ANGDGLQMTTRGMLVWRKADNFTAFTDGYRTWVNGPYGFQQRLNRERFCWEGDAQAFPTVPGPYCPSPNSQPPLVPIPAPSTNPAVTFLSVQGAPPGGIAHVSVRTAANAACTIQYITPRGVVSPSRDLVPKTADANGLVSWSWLIGLNTPLGTGAVTVTCNGQSATASITIG
ncbi:MAG TPA: hypothetical protein VMW65_07070, partial [Chloroflexota bacterium]|nr:hypothetical protein [Chloroflexota bacterium]